MTHILHTSTVHKTASLADEGDSAYCQSSGANNIKHRLKPMEISIEKERTVAWQDNANNL